jgi:hypothetical protein
MKALLKRVRDSVWTKGARDNFVGSIMAIAVAGAVGSLWLWSKSGFSNDAAAVWAASKLWLTSLIGIPRWLFYGVVAVFVYLVTRDLIRINRRFTDTANRLRSSTESLSQAVGSLSERVMAMEPPSEQIATVLRVLISAYPTPVVMSSLRAPLALSYAAAEKLFENLEQLGRVEILEGAHPTAVLLTREGRDYCIEFGLDRE